MEAIYDVNKPEEKLYFLLDEYLAERLNYSDFFSQFDRTLINGIYVQNLGELTKKEAKVFDGLYSDLSRLVEFGVEDVIRDSVLETKRSLIEQSSYSLRNPVFRLYWLVDRYLLDDISSDYFARDFLFAHNEITAGLLGERNIDALNNEEKEVFNSMFGLADIYPDFLSGGELKDLVRQKKGGVTDLARQRDFTKFLNL